MKTIYDWTVDRGMNYYLDQICKDYNNNNEFFTQRPIRELLDFLNQGEFRIYNNDRQTILTSITNLAIGDSETIIVKYKKHHKYYKFIITRIFTSSKNRYFVRYETITSKQKSHLKQQQSIDRYVDEGQSGQSTIHNPFGHSKLFFRSTSQDK
jgi:hypothetical protein